MTDRPLARCDVIVESVDGGKVVYVAEQQQAHYLDDVAAEVWDACDGTRTPADVGRQLDHDPASVVATLAQLAETGLLAPSSLRTAEDGEKFNRRALLRRGAVAGAATTIAAGTIMSVDVPSALATMSHALALVLYRTPNTACSTTLVTTDLRGTVVVSVSGVPGSPTLDKLTIVVTLTAYDISPGIAPEVFDISVNCGVSLGTITAGVTGAGGPVTVTTTVPHGQVSVVTVVPTTVQAGFTIYTKATPSFVG